MINKNMLNNVETIRKHSYRLEIGNAYFFIGVLVIAIMSLMLIESRGQQSAIKIKTSNQTIAIEYNGLDRLSGGTPVLQNERITIGSLLKMDFNRYKFQAADKSITVTFKKSSRPEIIGIYLSTAGTHAISSQEFQGFFFSQFPTYKEGVAFYRYKPWNSWTKPMKIKSPGDAETWDNQCFYWQCQDGVYGVAIPISNYGYRTTLGSENNRFGSKAVSYVDGYQTDLIPSMVIGFGDNLYTLMRNAYSSAMEFMGSSENLAKNKTFPEPLKYIGWCTWNASSQGNKLNEETVLRAAESFKSKNFPLGWILIDDGWFDHKGSQLRSLKPDAAKFPDGFRPLIKKLKQDFNLKHVGVWHAFNGYWNGIDPSSELGMRYRNELFSWKQKERVDIDDAPIVTYYFIKPTSDSLSAFYNSLHHYLKQEGFSFIKVDNQLSVERMSRGNYPIGNLAKSMHKQMNESAKKHFNNAIINCMDMTSDAYYNFGSTPVARSVEDYFPYEVGETYNLQRGNAAAHVLQGVYNNLYFSQFVFPDMDMFQTHNPNGEFHAIARAINNGPIYITDNVGEQKFDMLERMVLHDGKILRADQSLLPTHDCLFQVQDNKPFKAFSMSNGIGLLGVWNCADADLVSGTISPSDINNFKGKKFAIYESFSGKLQYGDQEVSIPIELKRMAYQLYYIARLENGIAPLGLLNKYNAPATIIDYTISTSKLIVHLKEGGRFCAVLPAKPVKVSVNGQSFNDFQFRSGLCTINTPQQMDNIPVEIRINL